VNRLSPFDEAALDWFFGEGQTLSERSTMGSMLERAEMFHVPRPAPDEELRLALLDWHEHPWLEPPGALTARPTLGAPPPSGQAPDESRLQRYAYVSRRLCRVAEREALHVAVLAAFYGDQGARWGRTPHGRIFAVYALTDAGTELLKRARRRTAARVARSASEELGAVAEVERVQPQPARALLLEQARRQAMRLYEHACAAWLEVRHG